ncbi:uncharacterized protein A1O9_03289 [Exophiala aquamarina CBS 119918]|uniref:GAR domain-containing protein n=1 Tax=Exophiala aquamarina CBS 119918 TaxID=1182545 RepID=A0A072PNS0_9EURO|nr:uncharacterized protein A1O9_03289 [Exophiala aquamarina CBS 119918]KEF61719.1 hypothetical protein A1O9_03289 [Exophiala aquamarina CBS 119918]
MALTTPTNAHFPRFDPPIDFDSQSPSRSPRRKAFAIKELDPLLANLSPDSTLKALRTTETIPGGAAQDALTTSIADASSSEREIGIRAAFAAQKLREWRTEVTQWKWPNKRERALGLGFTTPQNTESSRLEYLGSLPIDLVDQYEGRLDEIRDDLDSLGIEEIKDHVLEAHVPATKSDSTTKRPIGVRTSYGRMRDFTALITATVIQALPDLAKLNILLDEWDIRLKVLRNLPKFRLVLATVQSGIQSAMQELHEPDLSRDITDVAYDNKKAVLGEQVAELGRRADRLLDILEGHEDSLPQIWIDRLEKIELDYATWVVDAHRAVLKNNLSPSHTSTPVKDAISQGKVVAPFESANSTVPEPGAPHVPATLEPVGHVPPESGTSTATGLEPEPKAKRKPSLTIALPEVRGHKREASKVSVADSTFSAFSDISNAEIIDVTRTSVLPSPKINVVENPLKPNGEDSVWFGNQPVAKSQDGPKPPMLQRASTTSIEVVPNHQLRRVLLTRSASWDMLSQNMPESPAPSTPSKALKQLSGRESPKAKAPSAGLGDPSTSSHPSIPSLDPTSLPFPSPSLFVEPLRIRTKPEDLDPVLMPSLPRRSSKRNTIATEGASSPLPPISSASPITPKTNQEHESLSRKTSRTPTEPTTPKHNKRASLDEKIQDLLTSLPTKIRLAKDSDSFNITQPSSNSSTRASTPTPALTLSAVRNEPTSRKSSVGDSEIRLYHLTRAGQARDAPPVKLFVRTIGDGNRVMVRVGGGWADLGEYLKEYSLHHGSRTTGDGQLEVASFPVNGKRESVGSTNANGASGTKERRKSRSPVIAQTGFENNSPSKLQVMKPRSVLIKPRPADRGDTSAKDDVTWTPPPVPAIPASFTTISPTMRTTTSSDGAANTDIIDSDPNILPIALSFADPDTPSGMRSSTILSDDSTTTTTVVTPPTTSNTNYTPLGAAGPKINSKRATTYGGLPTASRDAWVEGIVGKARAVSGGSQAITNGPTTTTTTTTTISSTPKSRRASLFSSSPRSSPTSVGTISPSTSTGSADTGLKSRPTSLMPVSRPKNRMSLADIGGIKRVFLRKKTGDPAK